MRNTASAQARVWECVVFLFAPFLLLSFRAIDGFDDLLKFSPYLHVPILWQLFGITWMIMIAITFFGGFAWLTDDDKEARFSTKLSALVWVVPC